MYQTRYKQEPPEQKLEAKDIKTLDQSKDYAYRLRFRDDGPGGYSVMTLS